MSLRRITVEVPSPPLMHLGLVPKAFFLHNDSIELLHVYAFQPRERVLLVRVVRTGPALNEKAVRRRREALRRRYRLKDFEILKVEQGGRAYVAIIRQQNPGTLEDILEQLGAGVSLTTPTILRRDTSTMSFIADEHTEKEIIRILNGLGAPWRLRSRRALRSMPSPDEPTLTPRQREILSLAWNLGYFDIPARADLAKMSVLTGLSRNTLSQHLRRALRRVLREWAG